MSQLRNRLPLVGVGGLVLSAAIVAVVLITSSSSARDNRSTRPVSLTVATLHTHDGTILVGPGEETLYGFSRDTRDHDACAAISGCLRAWPILEARGAIAAGRGVSRSLLGTIGVGSVRQVTYDGHPLYLWAGASGPGDLSYVGAFGSGGTWPAVSPTGALVK